MQHFTSLQDISIHNAWLTIGAFDGVHLGHQEILSSLTASAHATGSPTVVLTFFPHPAIVLNGPRSSFYLNSPEEKAALLGAAGVDNVITYPFDERVAARTARDFLTELHAHLGFAQLWVGYDFAMGHNREGNVEVLTELGEEMGYTVRPIEPVRIAGELVSSSRIRELLLAGEVGKAATLLGRRYQLSGKVKRGDGRGKTIGIPTANLDIWRERVVPAKGVYACIAQLGEQILGAVANIGVRPTFEPEAVIHQVEAHLLDFEGDLYGQELKLDFLARLRNEKRFSGVEELTTQIRKDIGEARKLLKPQMLKQAEER